MGTFVQFGCGCCAPEEWVNFDASPFLRWKHISSIFWFYKKNQIRFPNNVRYGDIVKGLPIGDANVDLLYGSHVLEHLALDDFYKALRDCLRILKPGGTFRLVVPDLKARAERYLESLAAGKTDGNSRFLESSYLVSKTRQRDPVSALAFLFGNSRHLWMWDAPSITAALESVGFERVRRCQFGDSEHGAFHLVEEKERFFDDGIEELAMEAIRSP